MAARLGKGACFCACSWALHAQCSKIAQLLGFSLAQCLAQMPQMGKIPEEHGVGGQRDQKTD